MIFDVCSLENTASELILFTFFFLSLLRSFSVLVSIRTVTFFRFLLLL